MKTSNRDGFVIAAALLSITLVSTGCKSGGHSYYASSPSSPSYTTYGGDTSIPPPPPPPPGATVVQTPSAPTGAPPAAMPAGKTFTTPQDAMKAVADVAGTHDQARIEEIFGPGAMTVLSSGDDVADREAALKVKEMILTSINLEERDEDEVVASIGKEKWPFPIPLVKVPGGWRFDLEEGKDELLSRRIGRNELETIETMYAYVDAQREYFEKGRDGNAPAFAQMVRSTPGKHDGLYWENAANEPESPFGDLVEEAEAAGYQPRPDGSEPRSFQGYRYRILKGQGPNVSGGRKSYVASNGLMTGGYAAIAWPATYGNSGVMTFVVNQTGIVFEKDLGPDTEKIASAITEYDPDKTWRPSPHKHLEDK